MELTGKQMNNVTGGAIHWGIITGVVSGVVFIIGALSGYTNPTKCKNK